MNDKRTNESPLLFIKDSLIGENVKRSLKTLADLRGVFHNCEAYEQMSPDTLGEFYQFNLSSCIRQQNSLTAQFVSFSLANLANIFYPPRFLQ